MERLPRFSSGSLYMVFRLPYTGFLFCFSVRHTICRREDIPFFIFLRPTFCKKDHAFLQVFRIVTNDTFSIEPSFDVPHFDPIKDLLQFEAIACLKNLYRIYLLQ